MHSINLMFQIKDRVYIYELSRKGVVKAIFIDGEGIQYKVRYFDNAEAKTVYFYGDELKNVKR